MNVPDGSDSKIDLTDSIFFSEVLLDIASGVSSAFLKGWACKHCGYLDFPKSDTCLKCWNRDFEMVPLSRKGTLYSFSEIYIGSHWVDVPYIFGYVDLPENIRIFCQLEGSAESFRCDDIVELTVGEIGFDGNKKIISYKFKRLDKDN